jgi:VWFA-related protein
MRRFVAPVAFGVLVISIVALQPVGRAQSPQQAPPRFTAGVDVVEMDVSVLDKDRKSVRGLKAEDFTVREDGAPRRIVAFDEVYSAPPAPPSAPWMRDVPPDIETNEQAEHNLFVIVIDDALLSYTKPYTTDLYPVSDIRNITYKLNQAKVVARRVISGLTDQDLAAVIFSYDNMHGANFTRDRSKLLKAVDSLTVGPPIGCPQLVSSASTLLSSVEGLDAVKHRRKTVFYIAVGTDVPMSGPTDPCRAQAQGYIEDAIRFAQRANVNVYTFDPSGLRAVITDFDRKQIAYLQEAAENTGGRAIINTNEPAAHVAEVLDEARAYYLIGYELPVRGDDSRFHRIEVKVNRPGVEVHTRSTRFDPKPEGEARKTPPPLEAAVGGFLPTADLGLSIGAAPFAGGDGTARVEISLEGRLPGAVAAARDTLGLAVRAFTIDGQPVASVDRSVPVVLEPMPTETAGTTPARNGPRFSVSSEIALKPGSYNLRVGVHSAATGKTGGVYTDITVPDFLKEPLSLSGVVLTGSSGSSLRGDALTAIEPIALRTFANDDRVQAFLRIYQGGTEPPSPVALKIRLVDEHNAAVVNRVESLPAPAFSRSRQADYFLRLPLLSLKAGEYWLSIEAVSGKRSVKRDVRFAVR